MGLRSSPAQRRKSPRLESLLFCTNSNSTFIPGILLLVRTHGMEVD
jgi:hypothetical protein